MVVTGNLTRKVEAATSGGLNDISKEGVEITWCEMGEGTHGVRVRIPVECMVVQRLIPKRFLGHPMQRGKVSIDLIKKDLLRRWSFAVRVKLFGPVRILDEGTITGSVLVPV